MIPFNFRHNERIYDYDHIDYVFHNGHCYMIGDNGFQGLINKSGEWCIEPVYGYIVKDCLRNGYKTIIETGIETYTYIDTKKEGYVDKNMNVVFPAEYSDVTITSDGFILTKDNRMWKEDFEGNVTVPFMYEYMSNMTYSVGVNIEGYAIPELSDKYMLYYINGHYGIYNVKTKEAVTPAIYTDIETLDKDLFSVELEDSGCYVIDGSGKRVN